MIDKTIAFTCFYSSDESFEKSGWVAVSSICEKVPALTFNFDTLKPSAKEQNASYIKRNCVAWCAGGDNPNEVLLGLISNMLAFE